MGDYRRILVPTDFSAASSHALDEGVKLARKFNAELVVIHVNEGASDYASHFMTDTHVKSTMQLATQAARAELANIEQARFKDVKGRTVLVETGTAVESICSWAESHDVDLIVIATHGRSGLSRFLLGSVAERVVRHAPCHVLTVRAGQECCD